jgi:hypothetical protein
MWASALSDFIFAFCLFFIEVDIYDDNDWPTSIIVAFAWTFSEIVIEGVAFLLIQYGCGWKAAKRASLYGLVWVITSIFLNNSSGKMQHRAFSHFVFIYGSLRMELQHLLVGPSQFGLL